MVGPVCSCWWMSSTDFVNSGSYFRTVFVFISGTTTLTAFTGGRTGFFGSGFTVTGLVFFTCCLKTGFLSSALLPALAVVGCTGFAATAGCATGVVWAGFAGGVVFFEVV